MAHDPKSVASDGAQSSPVAEVNEDFQQLHFTVDAALIRELGERLVGQPQIALAELVKNSYDADARVVVVRFEEDWIEVRDNGHGMRLDELKDFWMRVGSPHKEKLERSRTFGRPLTGSKGVGRLAAQFLAKEIELRTVSEDDPETEVEVHVDWRETVKADDLTKATAQYRVVPRKTEFPDESPYGTVLILRGLNQAWGPEKIEELAREVWWLQPPFRIRDYRSPSSKDTSFDIRFESSDPEAAATFQNQISAILDIWQIKITGELYDPDKRDGEFGHVSISIDLRGEEWIVEEFRIPRCMLRHATFEVRVYELKYRQPGGIRVGVARDYIKRHGGIYVYDTGFRLPYYGPDHDWLGLDVDVARRLSVSQLLPSDLQVSDGLQRLATNDRLFGVVRVDTAAEARAHRAHAADGDPGEYLRIQVTRDRLIGNQAYENLRYMLRWTIDRAAMEEARRQAHRAEEGAKKQASQLPARTKVARVREVLERYREQIPSEVFDELRSGVAEAVAATETEAEVQAQRAGLLGSLATAGMAALAFEHEVQKQYQILEDVAEALATAAPGTDPARFTEIAEEIDRWVARARATRGLFSHLLNEENRDVRARFRARHLVRDVWEQLGVLARGIRFDYGDVADGLRLPEGGFAEWSALFQNLFVNAVNAVLDEESRVVCVSSSQDGSAHRIIVQDTGVGVDPASSEDLFEPFVRRSEISLERRALGAGGSGLGLTIVRMIASNLGATVRFTDPTPPFNTAVEVRWTSPNS